MSLSYKSLLENIPQCISDKSQSYHFLTERHMQAIWLEQKYFKNLKTSSGEAIQVISPGIWNADAGPDFRKAHIKVGNRDFKGDIELHLMEDSWHQHGHYQDSRYNDVVLHVSFWKPKSDKIIATHNGRVVLQLYLEDFLTIPAARIPQWVDLDLYPYKKFIGSGQCAQSLFRHLSAGQIKNFFCSAAEWRLSQKESHLACRSQSNSLMMGDGVAMALGYKNNSEAFVSIFEWLKTLQNNSEEMLMALAMKACGFFGDVYREKWKESARFQKYCKLADSININPPTAFSLSLNQIRPFNHPIRRLAVLIKLLRDPTLADLYEKLENLWLSQWHQCKNKKDWQKLFKKLLDFLPAYMDPYWNYHYTFEVEPKKELLSLMGNDLKTGIAINTFLPLLHKNVLNRSSWNELEAFRQFYDSLPASNAGKSRYLVHRFFGDSSKGAILKTAMSEQGAYQLHRDFCIHYEASCSGCPFVEKAKEMFNF